MTVAHALIFMALMINPQTGAESWTLNPQTPIYKSLVDCQTAKLRVEKFLAQPQMKMQVKKYGLTCMRVDREVK